MEKILDLQCNALPHVHNNSWKLMILFTASVSYGVNTSSRDTSSVKVINAKKQ